MADSGSMIIKVETGMLEKAAGEVEVHINKLADALSDAETKVKNSRYYWEGDARDTHEAKYKAKTSEMNDILNRFRGHVQSLLTIAGVYVETEAATHAQADALPDNIL